MGIKLVGVPQPKPIHGFSQNFPDMLTPRGSRAGVSGVSSKNCCRGNTFKILGS